MPVPKKTITEQQVIHAGLQVMTALGTQRVSLDDIADKIGVAEKDLYPFIQHSGDIFNLITRQTNKELATEYQSDASIPKRDQYFDLIMERLDLLQPYKTDIARFVKAIPKNPFSLLSFAPDFERSVVLMMRLAGDTPDQSGHYAKRLGLTWAYLSTLRLWLKDDSADASKTMAHLDQCLNRLEKMATKTPFKRSDKAA